MSLDLSKSSITWYVKGFIYQHVEFAESRMSQAPNLRSLLTELAGLDGLYCDKIAQAILTILVCVRCAK